MYGSAMYDADRDTCESHGVHINTQAVGLQSAVQTLAARGLAFASWVCETVHWLSASSTCSLLCLTPQGSCN